MVENFSKILERLSTIPFFCKKRGKTFDCFSRGRRVSIESSKGTNKQKQKNKNNVKGGKAIHSGGNSGKRGHASHKAYKDREHRRMEHLAHGFYRRHRFLVMHMEW